MTGGGAGRRAYGYVGPLELLAQVGDGMGGVRIGSAEDLDFICALCAAPLPRNWNITALGGSACEI